MKTDNWTFPVPGNMCSGTSSIYHCRFSGANTEGDWDLLNVHIELKA